MLYENGSLDSTITAAAGDDPALMAELRQAFSESLDYQIDLLSRARCDGNWHVAASRLKGLAASFNARELIDLSEMALQSAPGDPVIIRKIKNFQKVLQVSKPNC